MRVLLSLLVLWECVWNGEMVVWNRVVQVVIVAGHQVSLWMVVVHMWRRGRGIVCAWMLEEKGGCGGSRGMGRCGRCGRKRSRRGSRGGEGRWDGGGQRMYVMV